MNKEIKNIQLNYEDGTSETYNAGIGALLVNGDADETQLAMFVQDLTSLTMIRLMNKLTKELMKQI